MIRTNNSTNISPFYSKGKSHPVTVIFELDFGA